MLPKQRIFAAYDIFGASHEEASGSVLAQGVPGNLFKDKAVVGLVLVESPNDVVAVVVGIGSLVVSLEAGAICVAGRRPTNDGPSVLRNLGSREPFQSAVRMHPLFCPRQMHSLLQGRAKDRAGPRCTRRIKVLLDASLECLNPSCESFFSMNPSMLWLEVGAWGGINDQCVSIPIRQGKQRRNAIFSDACMCVCDYLMDAIARTRGIM